MQNKLKEFGINKSYCIDGKTYLITVNYAIKQEDCFKKIWQVFNRLTSGKELFFGFYLTDGITLSKSEWQKCGAEIPAFFMKNGEYREIIKEFINWRGRKKTIKGALVVASSVINAELSEELQWIFQYFLETTFFVPNISFNEFEDVYKNYMKQPTNEYVTNGYTDFVFTYFDSGDFSVCFDPQKHNIKDVCETLENIFL